MEWRVAAAGIILIFIFSPAIQAQTAVISRVFIPPIVVENETVQLKVIAFSASGYRVMDEPVGVMITITEYSTGKTVFSGNYSVFGLQILPTVPLPRGIYTVRVSMAGGRAYEDEMLVRPPPVPYLMDLADDGFSFRSYNPNQTFTIRIYAERGTVYDTYATYEGVSNLTVRFPHQGRYLVEVIDQWGWVNAFHHRDYWTGRGEPYVWNFGWTEEEPAKAKLPQTTLMNIGIGVVAIVIIIIFSRR